MVNTASANGSGLGDGIATLAKTHGYTITVRRQNLLDTKWPELRETLAHQVVL